VSEQDLAAMANYLNEKSLNGNQVVVRQDGGRSCETPRKCLQRTGKNKQFFTECSSIFDSLNFFSMSGMLVCHALFEFTGFDRQGDEVQSVIFVRSGSLAMLGTW